MAAWRDSLASQINQFQQNMHLHFPNFQLPALPPIPDYQPQAMVRRISSLMPHRMPSRTGSRANEPAAATTGADPSWRDWFSTQAAVPPPASSPPPAYEEIYPDRDEKPPADAKKMPELTAITEAVLDQKCAEFDKTEIESDSSVVARIKNLSNQMSSVTVQPARQPRAMRFSEDRALFVFWIPLLIALLALGAYMYAPQVTSFASTIAAYVPHREDFAVAA